MAWQTVLCLLLMAVTVLGESSMEQTCSKDNIATIQPGANALLGGIISLSEKGSDGFGCGKPFGSMQALESIRWVLDLLNKKQEFLQTEFLEDSYVPGVQLGMKVVNNCRSKKGAVASIPRVYEAMQGSADECTIHNDQMVFGIVGGSSSDEAADLSLALEQHDIPLVSYEATLPQLTMNNVHPNFMRTVAPDSLLTEVILRVMVDLDWKYIAVVYDTSTYGKSAYSELHTRMVHAGLCLTAGIAVDGSDHSDANMDSTLNRVLSTDATGVVFFGDESLAKALILRAGARMSETGDLQWIFTDFPISSSFDAPYMRGMITVTSAYRFIVEFEDHWVRLDEANPSTENPWLQPWFENLQDCSFSPTGGQRNCRDAMPTEVEKRRDFIQDQYVEPAVMAIFTYANALRMAQKDKCNDKTACADLVNMDRKVFHEQYLKKVNFTFTSDERVPSLASRNVLPYLSAKHLAYTDHGDIVNPSFYVWNYNDLKAGLSTGQYSFKQVGTFLNQFLDFNTRNVAMYDTLRQTRISNPNSLCPSTPCSPCQGLPADTKYYYEPGDIVINGIFTFHHQGSSPMSCGTAKSPNHVMYLEAMIYALKKINEDPVILPTVRLGGLGIDDCCNDMISQAFISEVQRGTLMIKDSSGGKLNPQMIEAYTAAYTNSATDLLAKISNKIKKPLVSYRAGSSKLDNEMMYPYFARAAPYTKAEVQTIILLLKYYGWQYVQMITSDEDFAKDAHMVFREMAAKEGICVVASHNLGDSEATASDAVQSLSYHGDVPVTVALLDADDHHRLLKALHSNQPVRSSITLVASASWNSKLVEGMESTAEGIISIGWTYSTLSSFQNYLRTLRAENHKVNPWFMEWFSQVYSCSMDAASSTGQPACDLSKAINDGPLFDVIYQVDSVINGVRAIAMALDEALTNFCGANYQGVCTTFHDNSESTKLMEYLRKTSFLVEDLSLRNTFSFEQSVIPYEVFNYRNKNHQKVGDINPWQMLVNMEGNVELFNGALPSAVHPKCPQPCIECLYVFNHLDYIYQPGDLMLGAMFNVHYNGMVPFGCGDIRISNGALYPTTFQYALDHINSGKGAVKLNDHNVKLGFVGFDSCSNPTRAMAILNRQSSGQIFLNDDVPFSDILSWVTYDSETTMEASMFLQRQGMPVVSPGATHPALRDNSKYSSLFRTTRSYATVAKGMADFINSMGWKYVLTLNSPDDSNREAVKLFRKYLKAHDICILGQYEFLTDGSMEVILTSLTKAETQVVAVFAEPDRYIEDFLKTKKDKFERKHLQFVANHAWFPYAFEYADLLTSSVFFRHDFPFSRSDFTDYVSDMRLGNQYGNPWYYAIFEALMKCDRPGTFTSRADCTSLDAVLPFDRFYEDIWALTTLDAVNALANAIDLTLKEKCGASYSGVCAKFSQDSDTRDRIMHFLDDSEFVGDYRAKLDFVLRESNLIYTVERLKVDGQSEEMGGVLKDGTLKLDDAASLKDTYYKFIVSRCSLTCQTCLDSDTNFQDFTLIPGDVFIVGLFDVHKESTSSPYTCGEINDKHGIQLLEAFHFAINYVNSHSGIFRNFGIQIGGIGLDMCKSPTRAANLVANIHSGKMSLKKGGGIVSPRQIDAYIATMDTESSIRVGDILNQLLIPQVSYGASGMDLLDRYDYFVRSVPADDKMGRAIISYLKKFEYNNIQLIKTFDEIGEPGAEEFERLAKVNLVCIQNKFLVGEHGDVKGDTEKIVGRLANDTMAQVLVLWTKNPIPLLEVISQYEAVYKNMLVVATDKWGSDPYFLSHLAIRPLLRAQNLILLDVETADVPGFDSYLAEKTPDNYFLNPWFKEFYEHFHNCDWDKGTCNKYKTIPRVDKYVQDPYVLYVVNAVFSAAKGIEGAVKELCQNDQSGICNSYINSGERRQKVLKYIKEVNFVDDTHQPFFYTADGQSDRGFHFYNVTKNIEYENVGSYNDSHFLKLDITYDNGYHAKCDPFGKDPNLDACVCPFKPDMPTRFMKKDDGGRGLTLVYVGDIHEGDSNNPYGCGKINTDVDLHHMLAFFYAINKINANQDFDLPDSIRLDGVALDSCTTSLRLGQDVYNIMSGNQFCDSDDLGTVISPSSIAAFVVDKDKNAIPLSSMLSKQGVTTISPTATHALLDDPFHHSHFLRTQGSDGDMNAAVLAVARRMNWNLMGIIYTDSLTHRSSKDSLLRMAWNVDDNENVCIGRIESLSMTATKDDAIAALDRVSTQIGLTGVVLFVEPAHFRLLMEHIHTLGSTGIVWIVPSNWAGANADIVKYSSELSGSIWIQSRSAILNDFKKFVKKSLTMENELGIPADWFKEIYESTHRCEILNLEERRSRRTYSSICTGDELVTDDMILQDPSILHVIISVYAAALGLNNVPQCSGKSLDIAACLQLEAQKNQLIYEGILGVNFEVLPALLGNRSFQFSFTREGNGEAGYVISSPNDQGRLMHLGQHTAQGLDINLRNFQQAVSFNQGGLPTSNCPPGATCQCVGRNGRSYSFTPNGPLKLENVQVGRRYLDPKTAKIIVVKEVPEVDERFGDIWAIVLAILAGLGAVVTLALFVYLLVMYPVRGGTTILGYMVSFGIFLLYLMVFPFIYHASDQICALRRFCLGIVYAMVYSALLVKLIDCWRVRGKNDAYSAKYSKLGRPIGLFSVTIFLILVQAMINAEWLILESPEVERVFYDNIYWPRCVPDDFYDEGLVLSLVYVMGLILLSFLLGICTFSLTLNHREARWIFAIIILSIPCWVIWCTVATIGEYKVRDAAVAVGILINATFMLLLMPVRKLYLLNKYNKMIEEEEKQMAADGNDYDSMYARQYDNRPEMHQGGSVRGSSIGYSSPR